MRVPDEQRWLSFAGSLALGLAVWRLAVLLPDYRRSQTSTRPVREETAALR